VGDNVLRVRAVDTRGNASELAFTVVREPDTPEPAAAPVAPPKPEPPVGGRFHALVIGIDGYNGEWPALRNAVRDAREVASLLRGRYGFEVTTLLDRDATRAAILTAMERLAGEAVRPEDSVLIYFSGHGELKKETNRGYWVPADARDRLMASLIPNSSIRELLAGVRARHVLLVSDACFAGDIFRGATTQSLPFEDTERYWREVHRRMSRQALTSGGVEPVTDGGRDGHSVFTYYLLKTLRENTSPLIDAGRLFEAIKIPVANNSDQAPVFQPVPYTSDEGGQFIFVKTP
jgi:uncharacterized caspase-like protein